MYKNMNKAYGTDGACMDIYYYQEPEEYTAEDWAASSTHGQTRVERWEDLPPVQTGEGTSSSTTYDEKHDGIYCAICGTKTYLAADGSHRRCPNCDDQSVNDTDWGNCTTDSNGTFWSYTC